MPYAAPSSCSEPLCPHPSVDRGRCALHQRTQAERGYGLAHQSARQHLRGTLPTGCGYCGREVTDADRWVAAHRTDGDPAAGWMVAHGDCNERAKEGRAPVGGGRGRDGLMTPSLLTPAPFLRTCHNVSQRTSHVNTPIRARFAHLVGRPGSGKTYLAAALARDLGLPVLDIADQPGHLTDPAQAWSSLRTRMNEPAIIESAGTSRYERGFWRGIPRFVVVCAAPDEVRAARLRARPEHESEPGYLMRMLAIARPEVSGHLWSGTDPIPGPRYANLLADARQFLAITEEAPFLLA